MNILNNVIETLRSENISAFYEEEWRITWKDNSNIEHYVKERNVAYSANRLAWFQSDLDSQHLLRVFDNNLNLNWEPITHNPVFGCYCLFIKWYNDYLIFIYIEKHDIYICSIKNGNVETFNFHGDQIIKRGDVIYFKEYGEDTGFIQRFHLSKFSLLKPLLSEQASSENIYPGCVDVIIGLEEK